MQLPKKSNMQTHFRNPQPVKAAWDTGSKGGAIIGAAVLGLAALAAASGTAFFMAPLFSITTTGIGAAIGVGAHIGIGAVAGHFAGGLAMAIPTKIVSYIPIINTAIKSPVHVRHQRVDFNIHHTDPVNHRNIDAEKFFQRAGRETPSSFRDRMKEEAARRAAEAKQFGGKGGI